MSSPMRSSVRIGTKMALTIMRDAVARYYPAHPEIDDIWRAVSYAPLPSDAAVYNELQRRVGSISQEGQRVQTP